MTLAQHRSPTLRLALSAGCTVLLLVLGVLALSAYGVGPSLFLFALAAVGLVDVIAISRRRTAH